MPKKLKNAIENLNIKNSGKRHAYRFYFLYITKLVCESDMNNKKNGYVDISSKEMRTHFTSKYKKLFLDKMLKQDLVKRTPFYFDKRGHNFKGIKIPKKNKPFGYRINPECLDFTELEFIALNKPVVVGQAVNITYHIQNLNQLVFDFNRMKMMIENINIENDIYKPDKSNLKAIRVIFSNGSKYFINVENIDKVLKDNQEFFQYKDEYHIANKDEFIRNKTLELKTSYCYSLSKLYNNQFYARRNDSNFRLDTNLTNLSKIFFTNDLIKWDGESLKEVDLRNSQPCILSYLLHHRGYAMSLINSSDICFPFFKPGDDLERFSMYAESGELYDLIASELGISREVAKLSIFEILFSSENFNSTNKKFLKTLFPSVVKWIDTFKSLNDDNTFPVLLQKLESYLFLDYLLPMLKSNHIKVLTKHDCFLCKERDEQKVRDIVQDGFDAIGFRFRLSA